MHLLVDQGNSRLKLATLSHHRLSEIEPIELKNLPTYLTENYVEKVCISSVQDQSKIDELLTILDDFEIPHAVARTNAIQKGLKNSYVHPGKMGVDRWLAMLAVWREIQSGFVLVDAGSALTFDWVNDQGEHQGGHIIPGLGLMHESLASNTDRVHFDTEKLATAYLLGTCTTLAVVNGCLTALSGYVEQQYLKISDDLQVPVFVTGGDADLLEKALSFVVNRRDDLVIKGLIEYFDLV